MTTISTVIDSLTGLLPAQAFRDQLDDALRESETLTLSLLDIDSFKELNDEHGHGAGDQLLQSLGARLDRFAHAAGGFASRLGGDEFAVALPGTTLESGFLQLDRLRAEITGERGLVPSVPNYRLGLSAGVANYPRDARNGAELQSRADRALWTAKEGGRNQTALPSNEEMVLKTAYYTTAQVGRLKLLAEKRRVKEAALLREALDDLLRKHDVK